VPLERLDVAVQRLGLVDVEFGGQFGDTALAVTQALLAIDFWVSRWEELGVGSYGFKAVLARRCGALFLALFAHAAQEAAEEEHFENRRGNEKSGATVGTLSFYEGRSW
jgi:hypothetical protein